MFAQINPWPCQGLSAALKKHFTKKSADDINELISNAKLSSADPKIIDCKALIESEHRSEFKNALWRQRMREHETFINRITSVLHDARHDLTAKLVDFHNS